MDENETLNGISVEGFKSLGHALRWTLVEAKYAFHCVSVEDKNKALEHIIKTVGDALKETGQEQKQLK